MKKLIFIFPFFFIGSIMAENNIKKFVTSEQSSEISKSNDKLLIVDSFGCRVSCYATAYNTETGESQTFYATASAELCGTASLLCQTNALSQALTYIESR